MYSVSNVVGNVLGQNESEFGIGFVIDELFITLILTVVYEVEVTCSNPFGIIVLSHALAIAHCLDLKYASRCLTVCKYRLANPITSPSVSPWSTPYTSSLAPTGVNESSGAAFVPRFQSKLHADMPRGLGKAILGTILARDSITVIAAVRDPSNETSQSLSTLPKGSNSNLLVTKYDAQSETDAASLVNFLKQEKISQLDVVIANAGIANDYNLLATVPFIAFKNHVETNAYGPLLLFQAVKPFLDNAQQPKFVVLGSPIGSISGMEMRPFPMGAYGASKAMLHYIVRKIHFENENLISFPVDPG